MAREGNCSSLPQPGQVSWADSRGPARLLKQLLPPSGVSLRVSGVTPKPRGGQRMATQDALLSFLSTSTCIRPPDPAKSIGTGYVCQACPASDSLDRPSLQPSYRLPLELQRCPKAALCDLGCIWAGGANLHISLPWSQPACPSPPDSNRF